MLQTRDAIASSMGGLAEQRFVSPPSLRLNHTSTASKPDHDGTPGHMRGTRYFYLKHAPFVYSRSVMRALGHVFREPLRTTHVSHSPRGPPCERRSLLTCRTGDQGGSAAWAHWRTSLPALRPSNRRFGKDYLRGPKSAEMRKVVAPQIVFPKSYIPQIER